MKSNNKCEDLELSLRDHIQELQLLQKLNNMANEGQSLDDILHDTTRGIRKTFNYAASDIYLHDEEAGELVLNTISIMPSFQTILVMVYW